MHVLIQQAGVLFMTHRVHVPFLLFEYRARILIGNGFQLHNNNHAKHDCIIVGLLYS